MSKQFLERNYATAALLDCAALGGQRRVEAERFVARQPLDVGLPPVPPMRGVELVQVTDEAPVEEIGVTLLGVLPPESVGREVPDGVAFGGKPPAIQGA